MTWFTAVVIAPNSYNKELVAPVISCYEFYVHMWLKVPSFAQSNIHEDIYIKTRQLFCQVRKTSQSLLPSLRLPMQELLGCIRYKVNFISPTFGFYVTFGSSVAFTKMLAWSASRARLLAIVEWNGVTSGQNQLDWHLAIYSSGLIEEFVFSTYFEACWKQRNTTRGSCDDNKVKWNIFVNFVTVDWCLHLIRIEG